MHFQRFCCCECKVMGLPAALGRMWPLCPRGHDDCWASAGTWMHRRLICGSLGGTHALAVARRQVLGVCL